MGRYQDSELAGFGILIPQSSILDADDLIVHRSGDTRASSFRTHELKWKADKKMSCSAISYIVA